MISTSDFLIKTVSSISEGEDGSFWLNQSNLSKQDDETTVNLGMIYRRLSEDEKSIFGLNVFYDQLLVIISALALVLNVYPGFDFSANLYSAISSKKL